MVGSSLEQEYLTGPGTGQEVEVSIAVEDHDTWTETDASAIRHAAVLLTLLELHTCRQPRLGIGTLIAIDPQDTILELAHEQVLNPVSVKVAHKRGGMANLCIDRFASRLDPYRWGQVISQDSSLHGNPSTQDQCQCP